MDLHFSQRFNRRTLTAELLKQLVIVAIIPIVITIIFTIWQLQPKVQQELVGHQQATAELITQQTKAQIGDAEAAINILFSVSKQFPDRPLRDLFSAFVEENNIFESLYLVNREGQITDIAIHEIDPVSANTLYLGLDISHSVIFKPEKMLAESGWTQTFLSAVTGRLSVAYYRPTVNGILIAELDINRLPQLSREMTGAGTLIMILDANHQLIAHPNPEFSQMQINLSQLNLVSLRSQQDVFSSEFYWGSVKFFGTITTMPDLGWHIIVAKNAKEMTKNLRDTFFLWSVSLVALLFLSIFLASLRMRSIRNRFSKLNEFADEIASGNYQEKTEAFQIDEFQQLSENLNTMSDAIEKREDKLRTKEEELLQLNAELEQRVAKRTEDLQSTNNELQQTIDALNNTMNQLVQAEKLASLGSLVAGVAHELSTPIGNANIASSSLSDFAQDLKGKLEKGSVKKSELSRFLDDTEMATNIASRNLERASELIVSFKQVAADQSSSQRREFRLIEVVDEILITLHPQMKKHPISVNTDIPETISLDSFPGPLGQVLSNLIINALIHGFDEEDEGTITISAQAQSKDIQITVHDNGKGIPLSLIQKVFDPFFTTRLGQGGSGLGLHICHNIISEVLGGDITVDSSETSGTTFTLLIPNKAPESIRSSSLDVQ